MPYTPPASSKIWDLDFIQIPYLVGEPSGTQTARKKQDETRAHSPVNSPECPRIEGDCGSGSQMLANLLITPRNVTARHRRREGAACSAEHLLPLPVLRVHPMAAASSGYAPSLWSGPIRASAPHPAPQPLPARLQIEIPIKVRVAQQAPLLDGQELGAHGIGHAAPVSEAEPVEAHHVTHGNRTCVARYLGGGSPRCGCATRTTFNSLRSITIDNQVGNWDLRRSPVPTRAGRQVDR